MSLGTGASGWWNLAMHSREGGIHGSPEAAATHLGTVTLKDLVESLQTNHKTLRPTQGRVGWAKSVKLASDCANRMSLQMIANSTLRVMVTRSPCEGPGPPQLYAASGSGLLRISVTKCPCKPS